VSYYQCPSAVLAEGETTYAVIVGKEAPFDQTGQGRRLSDLGPGYTKRILVAERKLTTCWMDPGAQIALEDARRGINVDPKGISSSHPSGANAGVSSGAATFLYENANFDEELRPLLGLLK
jgi:hypothetical protein